MSPLVVYTICCNQLDIGRVVYCHCTLQLQAPNFVIKGIEWVPDSNNDINDLIHDSDDSETSNVFLQSEIRKNSSQK